MRKIYFNYTEIKKNSTKKIILTLIALALTSFLFAQTTTSDTTKKEFKNVLGQVIKTISNSAFAKGNNKIEIDMSDLPSGLYFVQLQNGNKTANRKFIKQ